jgi:hypothetical protein
MHAGSWPRKLGAFSAPRFSTFPQTLNDIGAFILHSKVDILSNNFICDSIIFKQTLKNMGLPKLAGKIPWFVYIPVAVVVVLIIIIVPTAVVLSRPKYKCPPVLTAVSPSAFCSAEANSVRITGDGFGSAATVRLVSESNKNSTFNALSVVYENATSLLANFGAQQLPSGFYRIFVSNAAGCENADAADTPRVEVRPLVLAFFIDPPTIYNGVQIQATAFTSGLNRDVASATLQGPNGLPIAIAVSNDTSSPNRYLLTIPSGLAAGTYQVALRSSTGCSATLATGITVTGTLTITLGLVEPNYIWNAVDTAITITATAGSFQQVPRVYLTPSGGAATNASARRIDSVNYGGSTSLTAVIPAGLTLGSYDVVVVNPTGEVGVRTAAINVVSTQPPVIDNIVPSYFDTNRNATIYGARFEANATVASTCYDPALATSVDMPVSNVNFVSSTQIIAFFTVPTGFQAGYTCTVRVTNPTGSNFLYSAVSTKSPSSNFGTVRAAASLVVPRRGHATVSIKPTRSAKFLVAIGGDNGTLSTPIRSVERASLDRFANLGTWGERSDYALPTGLSYASAINVGSYIYLIGGYNGTQAVGTMYRAEVLSPEEIVDFDISINVLTSPGGFSQGLYFYTVSALLNSSDPTNPSGETLAAPAIPVQLPNINLLEVSVSWQAFPGARGYRIYRSPVAGVGVGAMELLAEIDGSAGGIYNDNGTIPTSPSTKPLSLGAIGRWMLLSEKLNTARYAHSMQSSVPANQNELYLWIFSGRNQSSFLNDYEYLVFNTASIPPTITTSWTAGGVLTHSGGTPLSPVAYQGSFILSSDDLSIVPAGSKLLFLASGEQSGQTLNSGFYSFKVSNSTPSLGDFNEILVSGATGVKNTRSEFCSIQAAGFLNIIAGGAPNSPTTALNQVVNAKPSSISGAGVATFPSSAWNPSGSLTASVRSLACVLESANIFFVGGFTGSAVSGVVGQVSQ